MAKDMNIDLSEADYEETQRLLSKVPSLSKDIVKHRRN